MRDFAHKIANKTGKRNTLCIQAAPTPIDLANQPINITLVNPFTTVENPTRKQATIRLPPLEFEARDMMPTDDTLRALRP